MICCGNRIKLTNRKKIDKTENLSSNNCDIIEKIEMNGWNQQKIKAAESFDNSSILFLRTNMRNRTLWIPFKSPFFHRVRGGKCDQLWWLVEWKSIELWNQVRNYIEFDKNVMLLFKEIERKKSFHNAWQKYREIC